MERIKRYEQFAKDFQSHFGSQITIPPQSREFFITKDFEYESVDFNFVLINILDETISEIQQSLISYINTPGNHSELASIDYNFIQKRKKELYEKYSICVDYKRKLSSKKIKNEYKIEKEFLEKFNEDIKELKEYTSEFIEKLNNHFQKEVKKIEQNKKQNLSGNMYA